VALSTHFQQIIDLRDVPDTVKLVKIKVDLTVAKYILTLKSKVVTCFDSYIQHTTLNCSNREI
jgi:hypothetical protein